MPLLNMHSMRSRRRVCSVSLRFRWGYVAKGQAFSDVVVVPQQPGNRYRGGPIWPGFYWRVRARTCWGILPIPIDTRPPEPAECHQAITAGAWCGTIVHHYGHMIASFGMRVVYAAALDPNLPLLFSLPAVEGFVPPLHFWQMIDALGADRARLLLVAEPVRVGMVYVFPQAERLYGGAPSARHLGLMDRLFGDKAAVEKDVACAFVSRARVTRGGQIAGEAYLNEVLAQFGVHVFYPEEHSVQEQIAFYSRVRHLIFSEGSAVHTLQLMGRLGADISILVRRPWRWHAFASLWPRARSLRYLRAVEALIRGVGPSRRVQHHRGISVLDEAKLLRAFRRVGLDLAPRWDAAEYRASRDRDIRSWIERRKRGLHAVDEQEHIDLQLRSLRIDVRY